MSYLTDKKIATVMIVEDDGPIVRVLGKKLEKESFSVLVAHDGKTGLNMCLKYHPDIILIDILMPKMDGETMIKKLREDKWGENATIMVLTNLSDPQRIMECSKHKVVDYLIKADWKIDDVVERIKKGLAEKNNFKKLFFY